MKIEKYGWILLGLIWGAMMFFTMSYVMPLIAGNDYNGHSLAIDITLWTIAGLGWGYFMKRHFIKQAAIKQKAEVG